MANANAFRLNLKSGRSVGGPKFESAEDDNYEDNTAFGDNLDIGAEYRSEALKADFSRVADQETLNFALDDQYLNQKWRRERRKAGLKWLATTLGILMAAIGFCFLGGFMFQSMEEFNELEQCKINRDKYYKAMDTAKQAIQASATNFQLTRAERLAQYSTTLDTLIQSFRNASWRGDDCETYQPRWHFLSATFFCVTVITSIGYGWIAPVTFWGRTVLIAYAVIGIPIYLAAMANIGSFLKNMVHYVYHMICCCHICKKGHVKSQNSQQMRQQMLALWRSEPNAPHETFLAALEDDSGGDSSEEDAADELAVEQHVPVPASLMILSMVFLFGGSIFSYTEDWSFLDGVYFSFVTVATIGFGDLVPGLVSTNTGKASPWKIGLNWFFIIFGMTMLSTCLQMIQENAAVFVRKGIKRFSHAGKKRPLDEALGVKPDTKVISDSSSYSDSSEAGGDDLHSHKASLPFNPYDRNAMKMVSSIPGPGNWGTMAVPPPVMISPQSAISLGLPPTARPSAAAVLNPNAASVSAVTRPGLPAVRPADPISASSRVNSSYQPPAMFRETSASSDRNDDNDLPEWARAGSAVSQQAPPMSLFRPPSSAKPTRLVSAKPASARVKSPLVEGSEEESEEDTFSRPKSVVSLAPPPVANESEDERNAETPAPVRQNIMQDDEDDEYEEEPKKLADNPGQKSLFVSDDEEDD